MIEKLEELIGNYWKIHGEEPESVTLHPFDYDLIRVDGFHLPPYNQDTRFYALRWCGIPLYCSCNVERL